MFLFVDFTLPEIVISRALRTVESSSTYLQQKKKKTDQDNIMYVSTENISLVTGDFEDQEYEDEECEKEEYYDLSIDDTLPGNVTWMPNEYSIYQDTDHGFTVGNQTPIKTAKNQSPFIIQESIGERKNIEVTHSQDRLHESQVETIESHVPQIEKGNLLQKGIALNIYEVD